MWPTDAAEHARYVALARACLEEAAFDAAWAAGRALPLDAAATEALALELPHA
jgi:hypothetical protein